MTGAKRAARRDSRRYPVAVLGAFGIENFGNDATLDAAMHGLTPYVGASEMLCVCSVLDYPRSRFGMDVDYLDGSPRAHRWTYSSNRIVRMLSRIPREIGRFVSAYRRMRDVDVLVIAGTGCLDDQHVGAGGLPLDMAIWCIAARAARTRVTMLSVGAGPIDSTVSRVLLRGAARAAHFISYRDAMSRDYMRSIGRDVTDDEVAPDLVFGLAVAAADIRRDTPTPTVAVGVLWRGNWAERPTEYDRYRDRLVALVISLWDAGNRVRLLIGDRADTESRDELAVALAKVDDVRAREQLECPAIGSFDDVLQAMVGCTGAVVSRYHHVVAALMTATPLVSLEYGFKNRAVMTDAGLGEWCLHIDDFDPEDVARRVSGVNADIGAVEQQAVEAFRSDVDRQYARVLAGAQR